MTTYIIKTKEELNVILAKKLEELLESASEEILDEFKDFVDRYVYGDGNRLPPTIYKNPNGREFRDSWDWTEIKRTAKNITKTMFFDWQQMSYDPMAFEMTPVDGNKIVGIHGSLVPTRGTVLEDVRQYMPELLNRRLSSQMKISVYRPQPYWKVFIRTMFQGGQLKRIIEKHAKKIGIEAY